MALTTFSSQLIADTGISMGDEGKGRLIPEIIAELQAATGLRDSVAIVMKVNGGANSGHTAGGLKLNLLPAGVISPDVTTLALGAGVVADPCKLWWEVRPLEAAGYHILRRLIVDERCMVSDVTHRLLDLAWEDYRVAVLGQTARGSTGRGITPAYADEVGQWQIYYADFRGDKDAFAAKMRARMDRCERMIQHVCRVSAERWHEFFDVLTTAEQRANQPAVDEGVFTPQEFDFTPFRSGTAFRFDEDAVIERWWAAGSSLNEQICDLRERVLSALQQERYVIGEFGQAFWLDKRHGFSPNVTASHTYTPEFFQSAGIPAQPVHTIGCCKAYDTKVGTHVFITEIEDGHPLGERLKKLEFGTSTGRQRMVGWFDAVEKGDALRYGGYQDLVINKLDALSYDQDESAGVLKVCTHYIDPAGQPVYHVPRDDRYRQTLQPVYTDLPGWKEDIRGVRSFHQLPAEARRYIAFCMQAIVNVAGRVNGDHAQSTLREELPNLRYIGVGPDPDQIIKDVPSTVELLKFS